MVATATKRCLKFPDFFLTNVKFSDQLNKQYINPDDGLNPPPTAIPSSTHLFSSSGKLWEGKGEKDEKGKIVFSSFPPAFPIRNKSFA